jgi:vacuolar-type H+-ATPase subunit I/STV1
MSTNLDKLVEALPEGLTETGIEEVASLLDEVVEERVAEELKLTEAKVKAFLRTKLDELKETARRELEADDKLVRAHKVYEAIKTIVAGELDGDDFSNASRAFEAENEKLQEELSVVQGQLNESLRTVDLLSSKVDHQEVELSQLSEALVDEREKAEVPFKSSESAVMITNESHDIQGLPDSARENFFLNEDVIRLSKLQRS